MTFRGASGAPQWQDVMADLGKAVGLAAWRLLLANPIVVRVVSIGSKRLPHLWTRAIYLVLLFLVVLVMSLGSTSGGSLSERAKSATRVFEWVSILQLAMMCLLAPVFTAGAISQEKDAETFNVLLTTPLTNAQIVLGSLCSRLFFVLALLVSGLPIFCITMLFGGVTAHQIFQSFGIAACTAILTGSIAIFISVVRVGTRGTIFSFYMGIALFLLAGLALSYPKATRVPETVVPGVSTGMSFVAPFHPYLALEVPLGKVHAPEPAAVAHYGWPLRWMLARPDSAYMVMTLIASFALVVGATFFVRRGIKQGEISLWRRLIQMRRSGGRDTRRARRVWSNPVAWREAVTRASAASSNLVRYSYMAGGIIAGGAVLWAYLTGSLGATPPSNAREAQFWLSAVVITEFVLVMLMAANTAATAITRERESETMELLLTTPLTSKYIVWGKLRGLVSFTVPLLAVPTVTVLVAALIDLARSTGNPNAAANPVAYLVSAVLLPPLLLVYSAFACILSLQMSLKSKRSVQAVLSSIGILTVVGFGLAMCAFGLASSAGEIAAIVSPFTFVTAIWYVLNPGEVASGSMRGAVDIAQAEALLTIGTIISLAVYGAIVAGMYRSMVKNFDMIVRKQSR